MSIIDAIVIGIPLIGMIQNSRVYIYRQRLNEFIYLRNLKDIDNDIYNYEWRRHAYDAVGYIEMVFKIWKPFDSFYDERLIKELRADQLKK